MKVISPRVVATLLAICALVPARPLVFANGQAPVPGTVVATRQPGSVIGTAWHHDNTPIANALLRLRNVTTGKIVIGTQANLQGRFTFLHVVPGSYIVELVEATGEIKAVGQMFSLGAGETVATFIRLGTRVPWYNGFFGNAAAAVLATAAALGVTAVGNGTQPASARF